MLGLDSQRVVSPRVHSQRVPAPPLPTASLEAEPVPEAARPQPVPLIRLVLPIVMVVAMVGMVALLVLGAGPDRQISPMMLLFPLMMLASVFMMFNPQSSSEDPDETRRTYVRHLKALRAKALEHGQRQREHEEYRNPPPGEVAALVGSERMWERAGEDPDALEVRVGTGPAALCTPVQVPDSGAAEDLDPVCAVSLRQVINAVGTLPDMPVIIQLQAFRFLGITGDGARELARAMVAQLTVAHGPETVGVEAIGKSWEWLKWLPHAREPDKARFRIIIVDNVPTTGVEEFLDDPTVTTIIDVGSQPNSALGIRAEQEGLCLRAEEGLHVVTAAGEESLGAVDELDEASAVLLARSLASFRRPEEQATRSRVGSDLLGLLGYRDIAELSDATMWPGRSPEERLRVPIGIEPSGQPVMLDLKESAHGGMGPHGLCIGATGSGKSELLRSLVTSLVATHSPDELNLVLVDFKGGATFLGCESLPHTAAVITNLEDEAPLVERMCDAISGEMNRRQELLRKAGNFANVGDFNADADAVADFGPLPALVIVVDEFSELLGQHPDFAELFVAVGRLGRSLHVHLLLASQRLEEGRLRGLDSHLSYRIGLKTFSAGESRQVLGVTDAYHLPAKPGSGYLKTDAEELVRMQLATSPDHSRAGLAQLPAGTAAAAWKSSTAGPPAPLKKVPRWSWIIPPRFSMPSWPPQPAQPSCVNNLHTKFGCHHYLTSSELPTVVAPVMDKLHGLNAAIALIDRPYRQRQDPLILDLNSSGGHLAICGGPQSGKSGALRTLTASLAATCSPDDVRFYAIDLGGGQLSTLERLPHVAGVAGRGEAEKIRRIVDEIAGFIRRPEARATFLLIDGWHHIGTTSAEFEDLAEPIADLVADGPSAGIHVIITTPRWTALRPAIRDLISQRLELRLGEAMDSLIDRKAQLKLPARPGAGLNQDAEVLAIAHTSNQDLAHICSLHANAEPVPALKMIPAVLNTVPAVDEGIALGIGGPDLDAVAWNPATDPHVVCVGSQGSGKSNTLATIMAGISALPRDEARLVVIDERRAHLGTLDEEMVAAYAATSSATQSALNDTAHTLRSRLPGPDITAAELAARSWWEGPEIYIVIDDLELVNDMALAPLVELMPHARDIGMHVIAARKSGGIGRALYGQFLSALRDGQPAVLLHDADREEGAIFGIKPTPQPPGRAHYSLRGSSQGLVQVAIHDSDVENEDNADNEEDKDA
ncbi:Type VII secretion protein EccCa/type VII secretion protein EccCb [Corynebacterium camporealensis]|nr:type VII secretion protein EccCa [Corynebacterium camporealensis]AVH87691.1 Type VII secretion protein EccCa/type VII secretion protein EccCb [Corynebacterium camporealensis]